MKISNKRKLQQVSSNHSSDIDFKDFTKLYKDYTKEQYSFYLIIWLYHHIIHHDLGKTYYKWVLVRKLKQSITKLCKTKFTTT